MAGWGSALNCLRFDWYAKLRLIERQVLHAFFAPHYGLICNRYSLNKIGRICIRNPEVEPSRMRANRRLP
jgi:hypothetical protein